jgi:hypothetical protein
LVRVFKKEMKVNYCKESVAKELVKVAEILVGQEPPHTPKYHVGQWVKMGQTDTVHEILQVGGVGAWIIYRIKNLTNGKIIEKAEEELLKPA